MLSVHSTAQRDLTARYPGARQLVAESGGHYIHLGQRAWFVQSVRAFINEGRTTVTIHASFRLFWGEPGLS